MYLVAVGQGLPICVGSCGTGMPICFGTCEPASHPADSLGDMHKTGCMCPHDPTVVPMIEIHKWPSDAMWMMFTGHLPRQP